MWEVNQKRLNRHLDVDELHVTQWHTFQLYPLDALKQYTSFHEDP